MPHGLESDSDAPEAISMKTAKKSSKAQDKLVQDRNAQYIPLPSSIWASFYTPDTYVIFFAAELRSLPKTKTGRRMHG